jgi:hypothetical protein
MAVNFQPSEGPPSVVRRARNAGAFMDLIDACHKEPGEWFEVDCDGNKNKAYSRATALRKTYGLDARARGAVVFVRLAPEGEDADTADQPA